MKPAVELFSFFFFLGGGFDFYFEFLFLTFGILLEFFLDPVDLYFYVCQG